jgi:endonuclease-3
MTRLEQQIAALERFYGLLPMPPRDPFALFVWEVLSAHAPPGRRDAAFAAMKRARVLTPDAIARAPVAKLDAALSLAGAYREQRLQALRLAVDHFRRTPSLPATIRVGLRAARRALQPLPQLDAAATRRMLLFAADYPILPVDVRVDRVARRLGYAAGAEPSRGARARRRLMRELPKQTDVFRRAYVYLSHHGAATCTEADPHCGVCPLFDDCPEGQRRRPRQIPHDK